MVKIVSTHLNRNKNKLKVNIQDGLVYKKSVLDRKVSQILNE